VAHSQIKKISYFQWLKIQVENIGYYINSNIPRSQIDFWLIIDFISFIFLFCLWTNYLFGVGNFEGFPPIFPTTLFMAIIDFILFLFFFTHFIYLEELKHDC